MTVLNFPFLNCSSLCLHYPSLSVLMALCNAGEQTFLINSIKTSVCAGTYTYLLPQQREICIAQVVESKQQQIASTASSGILSSALHQQHAPVSDLNTGGFFLQKRRFHRYLFKQLSSFFFSHLLNQTAFALLFSFFSLFSPLVEIVSLFLNVYHWMHVSGPKGHRQAFHTGVVHLPDCIFLNVYMLPNISAKVTNLCFNCHNSF